MIVFGEERRWRQENSQTWIWFFSKLPFLGIYYKIQHIHFLVHGHTSWSTFDLHLVRGPKALWIDFFKKSDNGSWTVKSDYGKGSSFMIQLHVYGVNQP